MLFYNNFKLEKNKFSKNFDDKNYVFLKAE